ncbi:MAG: acetyl ornithine aminotransferase family protein [Chloroflexi bacterium]|nr:acetyl ornithine aminotransferase family protein [Chloroflexota bacterium]
MAVLTISEKAPLLLTNLPGPKAQAHVARDRSVMSPSYTRPYPLVIDHGQDIHVWDVDGNRFIDLNAGIATTATGHSHPDVVRAIQQQAEKFIHMSGTDFYYEPQIALAEQLVQLVPGDFPKQVFFTNSGTEATEAAIKLARYTTGRQRLIAFYGGFHGRSMGALTLTASKAVHRAGFGPLLPGVSHAPYGYCYRCPVNLRYDSCDIDCVGFIEKTLFAREFPPDEVAAIFVEPVQGEGGYVVPPPEFMPRLRELCDRHGILLVADEIQSGMGRTGRMFALEHFGVVADITLVAKGIASGMPIGAMVARKELMTWPPGAHGNTFGGNPLSCVAGLETIKLLQGGLVQNAAQVGAHMLGMLKEMQRRHRSIGDVRGLGLMIGVELVSAWDGYSPNHKLREEVVYRCFEKGVLLLGAGYNTIRFMPPLVIDRETADIALEIFEQALSECEAEGESGV